MACWGSKATRGVTTCAHSPRVRYPLRMYETLSGGAKVTRGRLPGGDAGTRKTLGIMRQLAEQGAKDVTVREAAIAVVRSAGARAHDAAAELRALFVFVRDAVRFTSDVVGVETLQGPRYTLQVLAGDCDDRATLLVALARSIGIAADLSFRAVAINRNAPGAFSHVYVVAKVAGKRIALDPTYSQNLAGWEYPSPFRSMEVPA